MAPTSNPFFQPPAPIRTSTSDSQKSLSSGPASPASGSLSPSSTFSRISHFAASPTEDSFFATIASRVRRGRSGSRSRIDESRDRSGSPLVLPPSHVPSRASAQVSSPTYVPQRPQQPRHTSHASQSSTGSAIMRSSLQRERTNSDMWRGRHANSWLFNDFSVRETAKEVFHMYRKS